MCVESVDKFEPVTLYAKKKKIRHISSEDLVYLIRGPQPGLYFSGSRGVRHSLPLNIFSSSFNLNFRPFFEMVQFY